MDDTEDDARYPPNPYGVNHQQGYESSLRQKMPGLGGSYPRPVGSQYDDEDEEDDEEDEELGEEEDGNNNNNNGQSNGYTVVRKDVGDDIDDDDEDENDDDDEDEDEDDDNGEQKNYNGRSEDVDMERHLKKRKLKSLVSSYEFAPRIPAPSPSSAAKPSGPSPRQSFGGRNSLTDWTERETFVLLDAWGQRFIQRGKKSLRSEEWQEVAEKVSEVSKIDRTDTQCRNRLDTLKKKYKKEKLNLASKWVYFKKMDLLLSSPQQQPGLSCGLDSGEYVFMNPGVYLNRANGLDEMRDSPANSESAEGNDDDTDGLPPKKRKSGRDNGDGNEGSSFRLIADSIHKISEIYEKIESSKRQQMVELEKMRMDFQRDLEIQRRQIMERAQAEIAKIRRGVDEEIDVSAENASG